MSVALCHEQSLGLHTTTRDLILVSYNPFHNKRISWRQHPFINPTHLKISCLSCTTKTCNNQNQRRFTIIHYLCYNSANIRHTKQHLFQQYLNFSLTVLAPKQTTVAFQKKRICLKQWHEQRFQSRWGLAHCWFTNTPTAKTKPIYLYKASSRDRPSQPMLSR